VRELFDEQMKAIRKDFADSLEMLKTLENLSMREFDQKNLEFRVLR